MRHARVITFVLLLFVPLFIFAQKEGCTDPDALNYDSLAEINDGSCHFKIKPLWPKIAINNLPPLVNETSGLIYWNGGFWTHNDSGGEPSIYKIDSISGNVIQTIKLNGATNIDWEELAQDENFIYVGDFGNNLGTRTDLIIYKIGKDDIPDKVDTSINVEVIKFAYGDQNDFSYKNLGNDYDCEAMISFKDSLYLFSKNWVDLECRLYALPKQPGNYFIYPIDDFNSDGLITGASFDTENKRLILCGYKNYRPFVWAFDNFWRNDFFGGNKRRFSFPELIAVQTEGITYVENGVYFISAEKTKINNARLYKFILPGVKKL